MGCYWNKRLCWNVFDPGQCIEAVPGVQKNRRGSEASIILKIVMKFKMLVKMKIVQLMLDNSYT